MPSALQKYETKYGKAAKGMRKAFGGNKSSGGSSMWDKVKKAFSGPTAKDAMTKSTKKRAGY